MIIARAPLRITLGGGGTDLPSYYKEHEGFLISAAIDKYVYISLNKTFEKIFFLKYLNLEKVYDVNDIQHPIIREALKMHNIEPYVEISSAADIPGGTGLGSSSTFSVALLRALYAYKKRHVTPGILAEEACDIELNRLKEPIGKQDQYISAFGGVTCFKFEKDGRVEVSPLNISYNVLNELEERLLLFFTGIKRSASDILKDQDTRTKQNDKGMIENLHLVKEMGKRSKQHLESGDLDGFGRLMHEHWEHKKKRSGGMSNPEIDGWYQTALDNGAIGGKLIGAGGGGFLLFLVKDRELLKSAMKEKGLREVGFSFDFDGAKILVNDHNYR